MDDALLVRRFEGLGDLFRDRQRFFDAGSHRARCAATGPRPRRAPSRGTDTARFFETVDVGDVRMIQRRERLGFAFQTREPFGIVANDRAGP